MWGREAALPLRNVLDRRRYDWNWHTSALHTALSALKATINPQTPVFALLPELVPGFLLASLLAAESAGLHLDGIALPSDSDLAQVYWRPAEKPGETHSNTASLEQSAREGIRAHLLERAEPAPYLTAFTAGASAAAFSRAIPERPSGIPGDLFTHLQAALSRPFADRSFLRRYSAGGQAIPDSPEPDEERGWWWLADQVIERADGQTGLPLSDRIEVEIVRYLQKNPQVTQAEIEKVLSNPFCGLQTTPYDLLRACLEFLRRTACSTAGYLAAAGWRNRFRAPERPAGNAPLVRTGWRILGFQRPRRG